MTCAAGVGRTVITPYWGVELAGWGYYLERTWQDIQDDLYATAVVCDDGRNPVALVSLDLMVISEAFTRQVREQVQAETEILPSNILVCCTHSHNAPASGGLLGVGEVDPFYEEWAARQAATAIIEAWKHREEARFSTAHTNLTGLTFNRTREHGPVDPRLTVLRIDRRQGSPLALIVNFQAHPTVFSKLHPRAVSRDVPGEVCDLLEAALPETAVLYLQGACGDVSFLSGYASTVRCHEPARLLAGSALACQATAHDLEEPVLAGSFERVRIPTRRWTREEILHDRNEAQRRLKDHDVQGWRDTIGRVMTTKPEEMVERHGGDELKAVQAMCRFNLAWTYEILKDLETRPEWLETEVQALRVGDLHLVANSSELFSSFALDVRNRSGLEHLMVVCYANGRIGYMPDAHDIARKSYAAYQSPKYCLQFPFTNESGPALCDAMLEQLDACQKTK